MIKKLGKGVEKPKKGVTLWRSLKMEERYHSRLMYQDPMAITVSCLGLACFGPVRIVG